MRKKPVKKYRTFNNYQGLKGERALIASIVAVSVDDAMELGNPKDIDDARVYFADGRYEHHLSLLGLPDELLPEVISNGYAKV